MKNLLICGLLITTTQTGCGTMGYMASTYGVFSDAERSDFEHSGESYRIFDRKDISKVMITASLGAAFTNGAIRGATFGGINPDDDKTRYTKVAAAYLEKDRAKQLCNITSGELLVTPQWEFVYLCTAKPKS